LTAITPTSHPVVYLSGPMSSRPEFGYAAFHEAAASLRSQGFKVLNPAENFNGDTSRPYTDYMRVDICQITLADAIALLPGWESSKGAGQELTVAGFLELPAVDAETLLPIQPAPPESILEEAGRLVHGDRHEDYGHPLDDFTRTATMWGAILGGPVSAEQVALCMIGVKISRLCNSPKRDSMVDVAGYVETLAMVIDERARRAAVRPLKCDSGAL
jgi:hypothetical protein